MVKGSHSKEILIDTSCFMVQLLLILIYATKKVKVLGTLLIIFIPTPVVHKVDIKVDLFIR